MAGFLVGYHYEPEYTPEELEARCKAAVRVCTEATSAGSDWCQCACCRPMLTSSECVCCHTSELTLGSLKGRRCITEDRRMQTVVLNTDVLSVIYVQMMLDTGKQGLAPDILDDKYVLVDALAKQ